jgi:signal transduction histidine kinase
VGLAGLLGARALLAIAEWAHWAVAATQLRRSSVFLFVAGCIALVASTMRVLTPAALTLLLCYSFAWSVTPSILRLIETRPVALGASTIASVAGVVGLVLVLNRFFPGRSMFRPLGLLLFLAIVSLAAVAFAAVAGWLSELIIRAASRFGSLTARFCIFGCVVAALVADGREGIVWPITIVPNVVPGEARWGVSGELGLIVVATAALIRRLARDLQSARTQFRGIAGGEILRAPVVRGNEESNRLLKRIDQFADQLSKREFLEKVNSETRARSEQLGAAVRTLTETNNQRLHTERFSAIAGIVATVSHELRNPVGQIAGNLPLIRSYVEVTARGVRELPAGEAAAPGLLRKTAQRLSDSGRDVEESARRAALILGDLNAVSATPLRALEEVDLPAVIERSVRLTLRAPEVHLECVLEPVPKLTARAGEIEQVVANLIENAVDAVTPAGTISVRLRRAGAAVLLVVEDDGPGMTAEVLSHATEPFFTTKPKGRGTGLGLAIAVAIVRAHEGTLELLSHEGGGTRVDVRLPLREQACA